MIKNRAQAFNLEVENIVFRDRITYLDAIIHCCEKKNIEVEVAVKMLNKNIKDCLEAECSGLNLLKEKFAKLPI